MSGRSKRAWSPDRFSGSPSSAGRKVVESGAGHGSPPQGPPRGAQDVETLVGDFLKELDALATEIGHGPAAQGEKQPKAVAAPVIARDAAPPEPPAARAEEEIPREVEPAPRSDIDAELARALDELELQQKSNIVVLPSAMTRAAGPEPAAAPESDAGSAPEARPTTAAGEAAAMAPQPERVLFSSAGLSKPGRRIWKPVVRAAAVVFLAGAAFALYRLLPVAPNAAGPPSPPAGPSAAKPQIASQPAATSPQAAENAEITEPPEAPAPKPVTSAAKPSKAPAARTSEPQRAPARPAESPVPKRDSAPPEPPASQAVSPEPAPVNRAPAAAPEPPPATVYTPPVAVSKVTPEYPALARRSKITGAVEVEVQVDEQGKVVKATALSGPVLLRAAAEDALKRWLFKPAVRNGVNVRGVVRISVVFRQ